MLHYHPLLQFFPSAQFHAFPVPVLLSPHPLLPPVLATLLWWATSTVTLIFVSQSKDTEWCFISFLELGKLQVFTQYLLKERLLVCVYLYMYCIFACVFSLSLSLSCPSPKQNPYSQKPTLWHHGRKEGGRKEVSGCNCCKSHEFLLNHTI